MKYARSFLFLVAVQPCLCELFGMNNPGEECFERCGKAAGLCPGFCGQPGACCQLGKDNSEDESCGNRKAGCDGFHCCIPTFGALGRDVGVENEGRSCRSKCEGHPGSCPGFCGKRGACCQRGLNESVDCGEGSAGCNDGHCCTHMADNQDGMRNSGVHCHSSCDGKTGPCPSFCGPAGACCSLGSLGGEDDDACAYGKIGGKSDHVCVRASFENISNIGMSCHRECSKTSGKCKFCGPRGSCCRHGVDDSDDASCGHGAIGCEGEHCCVRSV